MVSIGYRVHLSRLWSILSFNSLMAGLTLWPRLFPPAPIVFKWLHFVKLSAPLIALVLGPTGQRLLSQATLVLIHCVHVSVRKATCVSPCIYVCESGHLCIYFRHWLRCLNDPGCEFSGFCVCLFVFFFSFLDWNIQQLLRSQLGSWGWWWYLQNMISTSHTSYNQ